MKKFSIVIPAYNCGKYIINCLNSIKTQTFTNYEIIIINDNSTLPFVYIYLFPNFCS